MSMEPPHPFTREPATACVADGYQPDVGRFYPFRVGPVRLLLQLARFRALGREVVVAQGVTLALRRSQDLG